MLTMPPNCNKDIKIDKNLIKDSKRYPRWEVLIYFAVYILYLIYGIYSIIGARSKILQIPSIDFETGWLHLARDNTNDEIENFTIYLKQWGPWYLLHIIVSTLTKIYLPSIRGFTNAAVTLLSLAFMLHQNTFGLFLFLNASFFVAALTEWKPAVWLLAGIWMLMINIMKYNEIWFDKLDYTEFYILINGISWSLLRSCSFGFNYANDIRNNRRRLDNYYTVQNYLGYTLYFPTLIYGPFISFRRYEPVCGVRKEIDIPLKERTKSLLRELFSVLVWWLVMYMSLHYLYVHYMTRDLFAAELMGTTFGKHAVGYFLGQFFFLYYVITYGISIAIARFDGIYPPKRPRCIGCIHFYSDMWKFFDEGLYEFLFDYIYSDLCSKRSTSMRKLFATAVTFGFVFVWHGCYNYVLLWSLLNFGCLVVEKMFKAFIASSFYAQVITERIGCRNAQRLRALLGTQIFIPAAFSNVYFIAGGEMGNYLMAGAYLSGFWNYIALTLCSYCFFQCSEILMSKKSE